MRTVQCKSQSIFFTGAQLNKTQQQQPKQKPTDRRTREKDCRFVFQFNGFDGILLCTRSIYANRAFAM